MAYSDPVKESAPLPAFLQTLNLRKALILLILALVVITTSAVTAFLPKWYRSTAAIRVLKIGATNAVFQTQSNDYYDPYFVQDQLRTIQSPKVLHPVIERLRLQEKLAAQLNITGPLPVDFTYDYLTRKKLIHAESPKTSSIIEITVDARDPALAAAIANEIVTVYTEDRINLATASQKADLAKLTDELGKAEKEVIARRDVVEKLRAELSISGIDLTNPRNNDMEVERLRQMESMLVALNVEANSLKTRYESFRDIPAAKRLTLVNAQLIEDPGTQRLQQTYLEAEQNVTKLSARLGEAHPEMIVANDNLSKIRTQLEAQLVGYEYTLKSKAGEAAARVTELKKQLDEAKTAQIENASNRMRPFE